MISSLRSAYCTTREAAEILGISIRTAQQWVESGLLEAWKTDGGHRRINRASLKRLLEGDARSAQRDVSAALGERLKVLVVEDDSVLLKLYKTVIAGWNLPIDVTTAGNGVDGLIRIGRDSPDVMITDLAMPGLDGFQLIRSLVATAYREGMEIVVVSGLNAADIKAGGALPKGIQILSKPVPFSQLRAIFEGALERRAAYLSAQPASSLQHGRELADATATPVMNNKPSSESQS
jgi:excisionase family DNA binding protein